MEVTYDALRKRIAELEAALHKINDKDSYPRGAYGPFAEIARAALEGKDEPKRIIPGIGEIGIDPYASPGNGNWYVKLCDGSYDVVGFDCEEDAIEELVAAAIRAKS